MAFFLTAAALYAGVALAQKSTDCPASTTTIIGTRPGYYTESDYSTYSETQTWTQTVDSYDATVTETIHGLMDFTTVSSNASTVTSFVPTGYETTYVCGDTITETQESTRTSYEGSYTSTPLVTRCPVESTWSVVYADGTTTETGVSTVLGKIIYATVTVPKGTSTVVGYDTTVTETAYPTVYTSGIETQTFSTSCTSTSYTATASAVATQAAKCAPKNLETNVEFINFAEFRDVSHFDTIQEGEAFKDASACCQACLDKNDCVAMIYQDDYACELYYDNEGKCPRAFVVTKNEPGRFVNPITVAAGCGTIEAEMA